MVEWSKAHFPTKRCALSRARNHKIPNIYKQDKTVLFVAPHFLYIFYRVGLYPHHRDGTPGSLVKIGELPLYDNILNEGVPEAVLTGVALLSQGVLHDSIPVISLNV